MEATEQDVTSAAEDSPTQDTFINRELSWLQFAQRVLEMAQNPDTPLLERVKFAGILGMIYDEFVMKRIGGLRRQLEREKQHMSADGLTPTQEFNLSRDELNRQTGILSDLVETQLRPALAGIGRPLLDYKDLSDEQRLEVDRIFDESILPILTPLSADAGHPFPFISGLSLSLAVTLKLPGKKRERFIRIKVPPNRDRWIEVCGDGYVPLEQVIAGNLGRMLPSGSKWECHFFRVARGAKDDPWDRVAEDDEIDLDPGCLIGMVSAELTARRYAGVVRLEVSSGTPKTLRRWLGEQLSTDKADIVDAGPLLALTDLVQLQPEGFPELRDEPHHSVTHPRLAHLEPEDTGGIFREIREGDLLLHHPYQDFDTSVLRFLESAARDPKVLAIKLTIYRTSKDSPIVRALTDAVQRGKQVAVLVEITARFDEAPNMIWGEQLEKAGAHVVYGMEHIKTHVKLGLVVREEEGKLRRYVHFATGNYNDRTARLYEDLSVLSCDDKLGATVAAVFNELTAGVPAPDYGDLLVAPHNLRQRFTELIQREAEHAGAGRPSGIRAKMNQLQDKKIIRELYGASRAGVPIALNVRGLCSLQAGVPGMSETIRVFSTLGRFLEHGRIYRFENGGEPEFYIGSADWMKRNLDNRMETIVPVRDADIRRQLEEILDVYDDDNVSTWDMQSDGSYVRREPAVGEAPRASQDVFIARAIAQTEGTG